MLMGYVDTMKTGDTITIHYNPNDHTDIRYKPETDDDVILCLVWSTFCLLFSFWIGNVFKGKDGLKKKGVLYVADNYRIIDVSHMVVVSKSKGKYRRDNSSISPAYKLVCEVYVRETGRVGP